eukprot:525102_1
MGVNESNISNDFNTKPINMTVIYPKQNEQFFTIRRNINELNNDALKTLCYGYIRIKIANTHYISVITSMIVKYFGSYNIQQQCTISVSDVTLYKNHFHRLLFFNISDINNNKCSKYEFSIQLKENNCTNWFYQHNGYGLQIGLFGINSQQIKTDEFFGIWKQFPFLYNADYKDTTKHIQDTYDCNGNRFFGDTYDCNGNRFFGDSKWNHLQYTLKIFQTYYISFSAKTETKNANKSQTYHYTCSYNMGCQDANTTEKVLYDKYKFNDKYCLTFNKKDVICIKYNEGMNGLKMLSFHKNKNKIFGNVALDSQYEYYPFFVSRGCDCVPDGFVFEASI